MRMSGSVSMEAYHTGIDVATNAGLMWKAKYEESRRAMALLVAACDGEIRIPSGLQVRFDYRNAALEEHYDLPSDSLVVRLQARPVGPDA